jgi:hypothetical protein
MENIQLTVDDLAAIRTILDLAATRGAFRATELTSVGVVYDKLNNFLNSLSNQDENPDAESNQDNGGTENTSENGE